MPDIVVRVKNGSKIAYLILDAKFARSEHVDRGVEKGGLASLLFFKYGLFLKTENGDPVDLVCALYPGLDGFALKDFKQSAVGSSSDPQLLSCALPARSVFEPGELRNIASKLFGSALAKVESLPAGPHKTAKVVITDAVRWAMDNRLESMGQNAALERIS